MSERSRARDGFGAGEGRWPRALGRLVVLLALALVLMQALRLAREGDRWRGLTRGQPAPRLRLPTLSGAVIDLEQWRGRVVLLELWATWCPPCREQFALLDRLQDELGARGLQALTVEIEGNLEQVRALVRQQDERRRRAGRPASAVVHALGNEAAAEAYRVQTIPQLVVIGRQGEVRYLHVGGGGEDELRQQLQRALVTDAAPKGSGATR